VLPRGVAVLPLVSGPVGVDAGVDHDLAAFSAHVQPWSELVGGAIRHELGAGVEDEVHSAVAGEGADSVRQVAGDVLECGEGFVAVGGGVVPVDV
jgi:hypothetical protein